MGFPDANDSTFAFGKPISLMYCFLDGIVLKRMRTGKNESRLNGNEREKEKKLGFADDCKCQIKKGPDLAATKKVERA
jgi:hypothetical protein